MILINLLPYREKEREEKRKQFTLGVVASAILGVVLSAGGYFLLESQINSQNERNDLLKAATEKAEVAAKEVEKLKKEKQLLLDKRKKVEEIQQERGRAAKLVDEIADALPPGTHLISINVSSGRGDGEGLPSYTIKGRATSDNRIASFMSRLPRTGTFKIPVLTSIKRGTNAQDFELQLTVAPPGSEPVILDIDDAVDTVRTAPEASVASGVPETASAESPAAATKVEETKIKPEETKGE